MAQKEAKLDQSVKGHQQQGEKGVSKGKTKSKDKSRDKGKGKAKEEGKNSS